MPTARPHNVGPCAARASCQKIDPAIELHAGGEVCPGFPRSDSHGHRCTRALAVRPLQPSRAWSRRLDRRHWRRPVALLGSRTVLPTKADRGSWTTYVVRSRLGVFNPRSWITCPTRLKRHVRLRAAAARSPRTPTARHLNPAMSVYRTWIPRSDYTRRRTPHHSHDRCGERCWRRSWTPSSTRCVDAPAIR